MSSYLLYNRLARYYDLIYASKDYLKEAQRLRALIRKYKKSRGKKLLEVACGTGRYLEHLEHLYACTGIDLNPAMLHRARKRLKKTELKQGDMRHFDLSKQFDVVLCLFSSVGYLNNYRELRQTMKCVSRHLKPGGVFILGPWLWPKQFMPDKPHLMTYDTPTLKLVRMDVAKRRGIHSVIDFHWLIAEEGKPVHYIPRDRHVLTMFTNEQYLRSMRLAGIRPYHFRATSPKARGIYVGVKRGT